MEWKNKAILLLVMYGILYEASASGRVYTKCLNNCIITKGKITGREDNDITLQFIIELVTDVFEYELTYQGNRVIKIQEQNENKVKVRSIDTSNPLWSIRKTNVVKRDNEVIFHLVLFSLNRNVHNGKVFKSKQNWDDLSGTPMHVEEKLSIDVHYGPEIVEGLKSQYAIVEGGPDTVIYLTLTGYPQPVVRNSYTDVQLPSQLISTATYRYELKVRPDKTYCNNDTYH